jgi:ABC-type polysaccharide/polyol phosphate export permease
VGLGRFRHDDRSPPARRPGARILTGRRRLGDAQGAHLFMLPFVPFMEAPAQAPVAFRSSAAQLGAIALVREGFRDILSRRRLIRYLVQADLKKKGSDTLLGNIWWVLDPLLQMVVYVILVSIIFQKSQPDYPLFVFAAILPWKWFSSTVQDAITSVVAAERLIKQIHFPKLVLPLASEFAGIAGFLFGLIPLFGLMLVFYQHRISLWVLLIPVVAFVQFLFTMAIATALSAINVFFRDVGNVSRHALRLWFYLSPALYSTSAIESLHTSNPIVYHLMTSNPFAILFGSYRNLIYDKTGPDWLGLAILSLVSIGLIALAILLFKRVEPSFAKVL